MLMLSSSSSSGGSCCCSSSSSSSSSQLELFVVQRCWFDGPQHPTEDHPMDCLRLFLQSSDAVECAYQSAHLYAHSFAGARLQRTNQTQQQQQHPPPQPVRTILLQQPSQQDHPTNHHHHHKNHHTTTSNNHSLFAFATCGKLFWVRRIGVADILTDQQQQQQQPPPPSFSFGAPFMTTETMMTPSVITTYQQAYAVVNQNVIGGTGYPRRGRERLTGCVVVVRSNSSSSSTVQQHHPHAVALLQRSWRAAVNHNEISPATTTILCLPVGQPPLHSNADRMADWPDGDKLRHFIHYYNSAAAAAAPTTTPGAAPHHHQPKRMMMDDKDNDHDNHHHHQQNDSPPWFSAFRNTNNHTIKDSAASTARPAKRQHVQA